TKTHTDITIVPPPLFSCNQTSSTPRRPLDESNSCSEFQVQSRTKKSLPHEPTPTNFNSNNKTITNNNITAISNCHDDDPVQQQKLPSAMKVASWIHHLIQQQSAQSLGDFSLLVPAGKNRYKVGVTTKKDFLLLWNCLPDSCAVVLRYVPTDLSKEFVTQEISKSIKSAIQFSKINYHRSRPTDDFRWGVRVGV
ncbi:unnamed protein product, partial [Rotaria sp. Silwood1]